jgi:hypothetical protein
MPTDRASLPERCRIREASLITGLDIRTLQEKAANGEIPGAEKPFGRWTFDVAKLRQLRSKGRQCAVSIKGMGFTGRVSGFADTNTVQAYERALAQSRSAG